MLYFNSSNGLFHYHFLTFYDIQSALWSYEPVTAEVIITVLSIRGEYSSHFLFLWGIFL